MRAAVTLPLTRLSPTRLPQRDFVLGYGEPLELVVKLVTEEGPDGQPVSMLGVRPVLTMYVHGEVPARDYGMHVAYATQQGVAEVAADGASATLYLPPNRSVVGRFGYILVYGGPAGARVLMRGVMEVLPTFGIPDWPGDTLPDGTIVTDDGEPILVIDVAAAMLTEAGGALLTEAGARLIA